MPYSASLDMIMAFLGECGQYILQSGVHMVLNKQGRPSGDAFIQMMSPEWAARAALDVSKGGCHKKHMGERWAKLSLCYFALETRCPVLLHGESILSMWYSHLRWTRDETKTKMAATFKNVLYLDMLRCFNVLGMKWIWC